MRGYWFSKAGTAVNENEYLASRGEEGWESRDLSPAVEQREVNHREGYNGFAPDLSMGVLYELEPSVPCCTGG